MGKYSGNRISCSRIISAVAGLSAVLALAGCTQANMGSVVSSIQVPHGASQPVTIVADGGGTLVTYAKRVAEMKQQRRQVRFAGRCDSACTLHLSMPDELVCIMPGATFGFHAPYGVSSRGNRVAADYLMRSYPEWVRNWLSIRGGLTSTLKTMGYDYSSRYLRPCEQDAQNVLRI